MSNLFRVTHYKNMGYFHKNSDGDYKNLPKSVTRLIKNYHSSTSSMYVYIMVLDDKTSYLFFKLVDSNGVRYLVTRVLNKTEDYIEDFQKVEISPDDDNTSSCRIIGSLCSIGILQNFQLNYKDSIDSFSALVQGILHSKSIIPYYNNFRKGTYEYENGIKIQTKGKFKGLYRIYKKHFKDTKLRVHFKIPYQNLVFYHNPDKGPYDSLMASDFGKVFPLTGVLNSSYGTNKLNIHTLNYDSLSPKYDNKSLIEKNIEVVKGLSKERG